MLTDCLRFTEKHILSHSTPDECWPKVHYKGLTSRHLLHEDLDEAVLADGAEVLNDVLVLEVFMQGDFFMQRL